jgi:hypothetical protein
VYCCRRLLLATALAAVSAPCALAAPVPGPPALAKTPSTPFVTQLKKQFDGFDLDRNELLDKEELAKAFRGASAKPPAQDMYDDKGHLTKTYYEAPTKYPDLVFRWGADKDVDGFVSWPEFRDYELKVQAAQKQMQQAWQRSMQSTRRRTATHSRRSYHYRRNYGRSYAHHSSYRPRSSTYHHPTRQVQYQQRYYSAQMQQAMLMNWQRNQPAYQRAYVAAVRQRMQAQQRVVNYVREQQVAAYRLAQRHWNAVYLAQQRRRH